MEQLPRAFGQYRLHRRIAQGGFGVVYEADSAALPGRRLALKLLHPEAAETPTAVKRLLHEATVAKAVVHPNVVQVLDSGVEGDTPYVVMALVEGQSLAALGQQLFARGLALDWRHAIDLVLGAIDGLDAIHRAVHPETGEPLGIVHRDLAPKNLMVTPSASMVVIDLGLGKSNLQDWATRTGALMGTPRYMSPEQLRGARTDARSDVYGMGVVCFELLTGVRYIEAGELHEVLRRVLDHPFRPPTALARQLPPALDPLLQRALALEVDERLPSMAALGAGLRAVLGDSRASIRDLPEWPELSGAGSTPAPAPPTDGGSLHGTLSFESTFVPAPPTTVEVAPTASTMPATRGRRGARGAVVGALSIGAFLIAFWVGRSAPWDAGPPPMRPVPPKTTPVPVARPVAEAIVPPPAPPPPAPRVRPTTPRPAAVAPPPPEAPASQVAPSTVRARADALVARASALKRARPELSADLNRIIADVSLWRATGASPEAERAIASAEARLDELVAR